MDSVMKKIADILMDEDIKKFMINNLNEEGIDTSKLYFGHTVFVGNAVQDIDNEWRILIDSGAITPHNRFFVDIINKETLGAKGGFTGIENVDNTGICVDGITLLSKVTNIERMSLEEIELFIGEYNKKENKKRR